MAYDDKSIIKDVNGKPVPQYFNKEADYYEVIESDSGMLKVILVDKMGNENISQDLVSQIDKKLDELIRVVKLIGI